MSITPSSAVRCSRRRRRAAAPAASPGTTGMGSASSSPYSGLAGADSGYSAGLENEDQRIVDRRASLAAPVPNSVVKGAR